MFDSRFELMQPHSLASLWTIGTPLVRARDFLLGLDLGIQEGSPPVNVVVLEHC